MNNKQFDTLWDMAEAEGRGARLAAEYPAWQARRRRATGMVAAVAAVLIVATPMILPQRETGDYLKVYCNLRGSNDRQWVDLAEDMLIS